MKNYTLGGHGGRKIMTSDPSHENRSDTTYICTTKVQGVLVPKTCFRDKRV